ncbi:Mitochondrial distribution and morphology protein 31, mitochondrial precursor [Chytriomyces hyalinus]|nr:Mitochondrial distribution and morphology protein 31, mitochondrial precursor [Chytriomyces hyalinus]
MHALSRIPRPALARIQPRFRLRHSLREGPSAFAPTRTDVVANSLRMRIRLFLRGRSEGNWRIDHVAAVLSWLVAGTGAVLLAGTTTVVSLLVMGANSISVQKYLAVKVSEYVSKESGFDISFDHAIMPNWKDGTIRIKNVDIVCNGDSWTKRVLEQRAIDQEASNPSPSETYAKRLLHSDASLAANSQQSPSAIQKQLDTSDIDLNWTYFAINVKTMDLTLNLWRYFQGHGIVQDMKLTGVRGVIDRAHVTWTEDWKPVHRKATPFDFALEQVVVEDLLLTIKNPYGFRPFNVSVYSGRLPILRQQWLLYDIMCADSIVGAFDNCLFSVHKWKTQTSSSGGEAGLGAEMSHLKINGLPIDHLNVGVTGPMSWLTNGSIDVDFHFLFPQQPDDQLFSQIRQEFAGFKYIAMDTLEKVKERHIERIRERGGDVVELLKHRNASVSGDNLGIDEEDTTTANTTSPQRGRTHVSQRTGTQYIETDVETEETKQLVDWYEPRRYPSRYTITGAGQTGEFRVPEKQDVNRPFEAPTILMHFAICLNDLRANVPLTSPQLGYMSHALIRPIVAYMNNHRVRIPLSFEARMELANFDGSWDFWSAGIVDIVAEEVGRAMTLLVLDERERARHLKRIGLWSVQTTTRNLMEIVDFVRGVTDFPLMGARAPAFA